MRSKKRESHKNIFQTTTEAKIKLRPILLDDEFVDYTFQKTESESGKESGSDSDNESKSDSSSSGSNSGSGSGSDRWVFYCFLLPQDKVPFYCN